MSAIISCKFVLTEEDDSSVTKKLVNLKSPTFKKTEATAVALPSQKPGDKRSTSSDPHYRQPPQPPLPRRRPSAPAPASPARSTL